MKTPIIIALMLIACASRQPVTQPVEASTYTPPDLEATAADYFQQGTRAGSLCEKAVLFSQAVEVSPDTKSGKLAASHLKRIDAKYNDHIKKTAVFYRGMYKRKVATSDISEFRAQIAVQTSDCSYQPAIDRMESALSAVDEKYQGQNVTY